jgi:hypothetical protein
MKLVRVLKRRGIIGTLSHASRILSQKSGWEEFRFRKVEKFKNPNEQELQEIEMQLLRLGIRVEDFYIDPMAFDAFQRENHFPADYHGGRDGGVWEEKLLEHFISAELLSLNRFNSNDIYVDIAAGSSPWVHHLRNQLGLNAYAIDLNIDKKFQEFSYYRKENAAALNFPDASIRAASLHCAYEMFLGQDDIDFIKEISRVLVPGGKVIIIPLYMHTHYCSYSTPEFWGKGCSDLGAKEYVKMECYGVPSSRKYDAEYLQRRVLGPAAQVGLSFRLLALRNKAQLGQGIYCHFILELTR